MGTTNSTATPLQARQLREASYKAATYHAIADSLSDAADWQNRVTWQVITDEIERARSLAAKFAEDAEQIRADIEAQS